MHRHFRIQIGRWRFENWHLYHERWTCSVKKPSNRWLKWERIF